MNRDLTRLLRPRIAWLCFPLIVFAVVAATTGCNRPDAKSEEKRIASEISRLAEQSSKEIGSDETMAPLMRLNELRPLFPERRDEIVREAGAVKTVFGRILKDDEKLARLYQQLLALPLSDSYRKCITAQAEIGELTSAKSQRIIDEMDLLADPAINDRQTLDEKVQALRHNDEQTVQKLRELEMYLDQNCRRPSSNRQEQ